MTNVQNKIFFKSLNEWQEYLSRHYSDLSTSRRKTGLSVFALEHGLSQTQLDEVFESLRRDISPHGINRQHWLLWIIYATEIGYGYDGEEYWQSFETVTPNWHHNHREDIRWAFEQFEKKFCGVRPIGAWAKHFSIISWPITHAILPRDLLSHFARLLYATRYKMRKINFNDSKALGKLLSANSYNIHSTRFQNFLQQEELVGRIAHAMLDDSTTENNNRIFPETLKRIVVDLEQKRNAREWMTTVRQDIKTRILGANTQRNQGGDHKNHSSQSRPFIKPRLTLRRADSESWNALIEVPGFSENLYDSSFLNYLRTRRIKITGVNGTWIPAEELLYGIQKKLSTWPSEKCVVIFDKPDASVESIIEDECRITEGSYWLFRLGTDGIAIEISGKVLRPGLKYIVVFKEEDRSFLNLTRECKVNCEGVLARILEVPNTISADDERSYIALGFQIQKSIKIFPVGLSARAWDGEGISEWLTSEIPCFAITHDHPVTEYQISIGALTSVINGKTPGTPTFFKTPKLPAGRHTMLIQPKGGSEISAGVLGKVVLDIKEPTSWVPGSTLHNGLTSFLDPPDDNLDSFLLNKVQLRVQGPANRNVKVYFEFYVGNEVIKATAPKTLSLPVLRNELQGMCSEILKDENLLVVKKMKVVIDAEELGRRTHTFQHNVAPLRWYFRSQGGEEWLRLIDETDAPDPLEVKLLSFDEPTTEILQSSQEWTRSKDVKNVKGLLTARRGKYEHSIILSRLQNNKSLEGIGVFPKITRPKNSDKLNSIMESIRVAQRWYVARCLNLIVHLQRQKVLETLAQDIFMNLCGSDWPQFESALLISSDFKANILTFSNRIENRSLANVLRFRLENKSTEVVRPDEEKSWFIGAVERCHVCQDKSLSYFAIKIASNPLQIDEYFGDDFQVKVSKLFQHPVLIRAARFYALGISKIIDPNKADSFILPAGWKWK